MHFATSRRGGNAEGSRKHSAHYLKDAKVLTDASSASWTSIGLHLQIIVLKIQYILASSEYKNIFPNFSSIVSF